MRYLITGGTGTLGRAVIRQIYADDPWAVITVFSREELKQKKLYKDFPNVLCRLGDVASGMDLDRAFDCARPEVVFHLAALKHVDIAEENPHYCMAVNYGGTQNVLDLAKKYKSEHIVFSSTDKAVLPINIYGASKMAAEKLLLIENQYNVDVKSCVYRWGNICGSRGSVIHSFVDTLLNQRKVYITDLSMTRFWMHIDDAAKFMVSTYRGATNTRVMIPQMKASKIIDLAAAVARFLEITDYEVEEIGIRAGEKYHECLWTDHDRCLRSDTADQFSVDELDKLVARVLT